MLTAFSPELRPDYNRNWASKAGEPLVLGSEEPEKDSVAANARPESS